MVCDNSFLDCIAVFSLIRGVDTVRANHSRDELAILWDSGLTAFLALQGRRVIDHFLQDVVLLLAIRQRIALILHLVLRQSVRAEVNKAGLMHSDLFRLHLFPPTQVLLG